MMLALMLCFVPYPAKGLLGVYEDIVEILLMLRVFLAEDSEIEYLFFGSSSSVTSLLLYNIASAYGWSLFRMIFNTNLLGWLMDL